MVEHYLTQDTKGQCGDSHLGEIWVQCPHNASGYFTIYGEDSRFVCLLHLWCSLFELF